MNLKFLAIAIFLCVATFHTLSAQNIEASIPGDFADPSIIRKGDAYFAIGTSSEWGPHFPIFKSTNLTNWEQTGFLFEEAPAWTKSSFWAPEYYFHKGTYYVYYTARRKSDGISCIGVATSKFPDRGFKDHGVLIAYGSEAIDAFVFDDNGQLYISWKAYGLDKRPIEILGSRLSDDGLSLVGTPFMLLKDNQGVGIEGQSLLKKGDYYYLFYSAGACCGIGCTYNVRVARAGAITGPYEDFDKNPILTDRGDWKCPGHGTFVTDKNGKTFYIYHAYSQLGNVFTGREGLITELLWKENAWPEFSNTIITKAKDHHFRVDFAKEKRPIYWQWDFRQMQPVVSQVGGKLNLSGKYDTQNEAGIALTLRPYTASYEISTLVLNTNEAAKGLIIYGDVSASIGVAVHQDKVLFWVIKEGKRVVINEQQLQQKNLPVELKMKVLPNFTCRAYWKQNGDWVELNLNREAYAIDFLPPWDRSPRPGLNFSGPSHTNAAFGFFELKYVTN